jgi:hypothetical protein
LEVNVIWSNTEQNCQFVNDFFVCPVNFGKEEISFICQTDILKQPLLGGNPLLTQSHEKMLDDYLFRLD